MGARVSIIMPVYNTGPYLAEAIGSVLRQTCRDWELIVVDDGSTDDSPSLLAACHDERIRVIRQDNAGQSVARNRAMEVARGEYVYFMDSDDVVEPDLLAACLASIGTDDFLFFNGDTMGASAAAWQRYEMAELFAEGTLRGADVLQEAMRRYHWRCVVWALFIRRAYIDALGLTFRPGIIHEDELYSGLLFAHSMRCHALRRTLVHYRIHEASTMGVGFGLRNVRCYAVVCHLLLEDGHAAASRLAEYTVAGILPSVRRLGLPGRMRAVAILARHGLLHVCSWRALMLLLMGSRG